MSNTLKLTSRWVLIPALVASLLAGCASRGTTTAQPATPTPIELPTSAAPAPELAPLAFMAGRWIGVNPNKTVNEEHWMAPRGNHMIALFRQVRRDGKPAFAEVSLITADPDGVTLKLRHLHGGLEVPENRKELSVFKLKSAGDNRAEFVGTGAAAQVAGVAYRLVSPNELEVEVSFAPESKEKGFTSKYRRE